MIGASAYDTFIDIEHNPFIDWSNHGIEQLPNQWSTDDVACAKVLSKIRKEILKCEVVLAHPPIMFSDEQRLIWSTNLHEQIQYWTSRLSDAHYN